MKPDTIVICVTLIVCTTGLIYAIQWAAKLIHG